ncbi:MAG: ester cyclase [Actinobacteria bacterium]|nr:MAG: ester cyclase [Actinomycetota bacterium]
MADASKRLVRRLIDEAYNDGRLDVVDELFVPDAVVHDPALQHDVAGVNAIKEMIGGFRRAFPDFVVLVDDQVAEGDRVALRWTARGTHQGDLWGIAATGKEITITGTSLYRFAIGRIAESWTNWDTIGLMQQLGVVPPFARV